MPSEEGSKAVRLRVFGFFREHPVHAFRVDTIAKYLKLEKDEVQKALDDLLSVDVVDIRYQLTTEEFVGIIVDELTRESKIDA